MKISVVMNTYNENKNWLLQAIDSYLKQDSVNVDLIISTVKNDLSIDVANKKGLKISISESGGIYNQLNNSLNLVDGDWYCYASSNDVALPTKLKDEVELCIKNNKKVCYSAYYQSDKNLNNKKIIKFYNYSYRKHMTGSNFVSDLAMVKRDILEKYKPFNENFHNFAYYDFWLRVAEGEGENVFIYNPKPEWIYRITKQSRHVKRSKDLEWISRNNMNKIIMLKSHK